MLSRVEGRDIDGLAGLIDAGEQERIADRTGLDQIDGPPKNTLQLVGQIEKLAQRRQTGPWNELHEKIRIACHRIEIRVTRSRAENVQP